MADNRSVTQGGIAPSCVLLVPLTRFFWSSTCLPSTNFRVLTTCRRPSCSCLAKFAEQPVVRLKYDSKRSLTRKSRLTAPIDSPVATMCCMAPACSTWIVAMPAGNTRQSTAYESVCLAGKEKFDGGGSKGGRGGGGGCATQVVIASAHDAINFGYLITHSHQSMAEAQNGQQHSVK